jgi:hypothetical protein
LPHKNPYIPFCPPAFQNPTLKKGEFLDASTPLQFITPKANSTLPHEGPTVIVELIGATHNKVITPNQLHNPHYGETQTGDRPEFPPTTPIPYTAKCFPRLTPSYVTLFGNLHETITKHVQNHPESYTAIIPFGAGP